MSGKDKLKIVYVTNESFIDHSYTIVNELRDRIEIAVYMIAKDYNQEVKEWCEKFEAVFVKRKFKYRNLLSLFSEVSFIIQLRKVKCDYYWFNTLNSYQALLVKFFLKNYFINVHDVDPHPRTKDYNYLIASKLKSKLYKKNISVVSCTQAEIYEKKSGIRPKVFLLPIINYYTGKSEDKDVYNSRTAVDMKNMLKFFFFGTIEHYKGLDILIEAAELLVNNGLKFELNIFGKVRQNEEAILERISAINNVNLNNKFVDYKEIYKIYKENDVLVLPYRQVTQCGPLLIGFNQNLPSLCSDLQGFREYVEDGYSGWLFENNPEILASKMQYLINNCEKITEARNYIANTTKNKFGMNILYKDYIENFYK